MLFSNQDQPILFDVSHGVDDHPIKQPLSTRCSVVEIVVFPPWWPGGPGKPQKVSASSSGGVSFGSLAI